MNGWRLSLQRIAVGVGLAGFALGGCGSDGDGGSGSPCSPGATQACVCAGGAAGGQACAADGSRWLACDCSGGAVIPDGGTTPDGGGGGGSTAGFVRVEPGTFTMGSPSGEPGRDSDEAQHEVTLTRAFYLQATEVTQGQWRALMNNNPSGFNSCGDDCPVETVNWWEAAAYANALSGQEGLPACYALEGCSEVSPGNYMKCGGVSVNAPGGDPYQCAGYRLPTEAEWEYAYRAGTTTAYYDPNLDAIAWYGSNSAGTTHLVGEKTPNAWGLYDMAGNVWEWCWDWYGDYPLSGVTNPTGSGSVSFRVYRGGSWYFDADGARAAGRGNYHPDFRYSYLGFRLARSAP